MPPQGSRCSTTVTRGSRGVPCPAGLECVITDPGHPEYDAPNSGFCQAHPVDPLPPQGNPACWSGAYNADRCCKGASGDASSWSGRYTFQFSCKGNGH
jgi:hypothetical protein